MNIATREAWNNKAAGIVSYGRTGRARPAEHLRGFCGELFIENVKTHPTLSLFTDFETLQHINHLYYILLISI